MLDSECDTAFMVADFMVASARTAPKGCGKDNVVSMVISGEEKDKLANVIRELCVEYSEDFLGGTRVMLMQVIV